MAYFRNLKKEIEARWVRKRLQRRRNWLSDGTQALLIQGITEETQGGPCYDILSTYNIDGISAHAHDATEPVPAAQLQAQDSLLLPPPNFRTLIG